MMVFRSRKLIGLIALGFLAAAGAVAWWQKTPLEAWYYTRQLASADKTSRAIWIERAVGLGEAIIPRLLDCLVSENTRLCENAEIVLGKLAESWTSADIRMANLSEQIATEFPRFSHPGKQAAMRLHATWLNDDDMNADVRAAVARNATRLLGDAARINDPEMRTAALNLATVTPLVESSPELLARFLDDPAPLVRRRAMLAVGPLPGVVATDDLVYWLHDSDAEVCRYCEAALRGRGLQAEQIKLARLITDRQPGVRLQVLDKLLGADVEPGAWLRRLSHDQSPAVRVAAMRAAVESPLSQMVDLQDRIGQMAQSDPNPTVCQLARFYLSYPKQLPSSE